MIKNLEYFHGRHTLFAISDKKNIYIKNSYAGNKKKLEINQQNRFQTSGTGSLLNLTKVRITTKRNRSMNMNIKKGGITIDITMMNLI